MSTAAIRVSRLHSAFQLEVALVVGAFVKLFRYQAIHEENPARAGVWTKPADGTLIDLALRTPGLAQI